MYAKYDDVNGIHHYEYTQDLVIVSFLIELPNDNATTLPNGAVAVTNYEYEDRLQNRSKRLDLSNQNISQIIKEFSKKIKGV